MNTPDINPGNSVNSGLDFSNILGFLQTLMAMKSGGGGAAAKPANAAAIRRWPAVRNFPFDDRRNRAVRSNIFQ